MVMLCIRMLAYYLLLGSVIGTLRVILVARAISRAVGIATIKLWKY